MIRFNCSGCGATLKVSDDTGGKTGKCPGCGIVLTVPTATAAKSPSHTPSKVGPPTVSSARAPAAGGPSRRKVALIVGSSAAGLVAMGFVFFWWLPARREQRIAERRRQIAEKADHRAFAAARQAAAGAGRDEKQAVAAFQRYLQTYPNGHHINDARQAIKAIDESSFGNARRGAAGATADPAKAVAAYTRYLLDFPSGDHTEEAKSALAKLDDESFARASRMTGTAARTPDRVSAAYRRYLRAFPKGEHAHEARKQLHQMDDARFEAAKQAADKATDAEPAIAAYDSYLKAYPKGRSAHKAKSTLAALKAKLQTDDADFSQAKSKARASADVDAKIRAYRAYLDKHPGGRHPGEAIGEVAALLTDDKLADDWLAAVLFREADVDLPEPGAKSPKGGRVTYWEHWDRLQEARQQELKTIQTNRHAQIVARMKTDKMVGSDMPPAPDPGQRMPGGGIATLEDFYAGYRGRMRKTLAIKLSARAEVIYEFKTTSDGLYARKKSKGGPAVRWPRFVMQGAVYWMGRYESADVFGMIPANAPAENDMAKLGAEYQQRLKWLKSPDALKMPTRAP